ncbi:MAG: hypothetical protein ACFE0J_12340 [Elainellaceae cyanobacterium]
MALLLQMAKARSPARRTDSGCFLYQVKAGQPLISIDPGAIALLTHCV